MHIWSIFAVTARENNYTEKQKNAQSNIRVKFKPIRNSHVVRRIFSSANPTLLYGTDLYANSKEHVQTRPLPGVSAATEPFEKFLECPYFKSRVVFEISTQLTLLFTISKYFELKRIEFQLFVRFLK